MLLFFNISGGELAIIALLIFIVLGPDKLPEIARKFGKMMRFIRKATADIKNEINIDEDLVQKPRSYTAKKKPAPVSKEEDTVNNQEDIDPPKTESKEDNKTDN